MGNECCTKRKEEQLIPAASDKDREEETFLVKKKDCFIEFYNHFFLRGDTIMAKHEQILRGLQNSIEEMLRADRSHNNDSNGVYDCIIGFIWAVATELASKNRLEKFSCQITDSYPFIVVSLDGVNVARNMELEIFRENMQIYIELLSNGRHKLKEASKELTEFVLEAEEKEAKTKEVAAADETLSPILQSKASVAVNHNCRAFRMKKVLSEQFLSRLEQQYTDFIDHLQFFREAVNRASEMAQKAVEENITRPLDVLILFSEEIHQLRKPLTLK